MCVCVCVCPPGRPGRAGSSTPRTAPPCAVTATIYSSVPPGGSRRVGALPARAWAWALRGSRGGVGLTPVGPWAWLADPTISRARDGATPCIACTGFWVAARSRAALLWLQGIHFRRALVAASGPSMAVCFRDRHFVFIGTSRRLRAARRAEGRRAQAQVAVVAPRCSSAPRRHRFQADP